MPLPIDIGYVILFAVVIMAFETVYYFPRFKAAVLAGVPNARRDGYRRTVIGQWVLAAATIGIWMANGRSWATLGLVPPGDGRMLAGVALIVILSLFAAQQLRAMGRIKPARRDAIRTKLTTLGFLLPHTREEYRWFTVLSVTAGICEELLYRGYLMWFLRSYLGVVGAVVASVVLFGAAHLYQGTAGALKSAAAALVMSLIVLATGWLIPAMVVHALIDANSGALGFTVLRETAPSIAASA